MSHRSLESRGPHVQRPAPGKAAGIGGQGHAATKSAGDDRLRRVEHAFL